MKSTLIITTYNWPLALGFVLKSAMAQTILPGEIIVADDGSSKSTKKLIADFGKSSIIPVKHVRQNDRGFRAARIRNKAIAVASHEYIVMIDGDMILEKHFIEDHQHAATDSQFIQGSRVILSIAFSEMLLERDVISSVPIWSLGLGNRKNCLRSKALSCIFSKSSNSLNGIKTCNFSFWKEDAITVNGFNEDFEGWGREDSEFAVRLMNAGKIRKNLRFQAIAYHISHPLQDRIMLESNDLLLAKSIHKKLHRCDNGLDKYK